MGGLGSETFQKLIDGRITPERIKNASKYEEGMEKSPIPVRNSEKFSNCYKHLSCQNYILRNLESFL